MTAVAIVTVSAARVTAIAQKLEFSPDLPSRGSEARFARSRSTPGACLLAAALFLGGCASEPSKAPVAAPRVESLAELMHRADTAAAAGDKNKARDNYRAAAKVEPTSQLPWLKLAESYFEAADYGNAILAAQEVLNRDGADNAVAGILALSGLRVSTSAVSVLRQRNNLGASTRGEAETLSKNLKDLLGESAPAARQAKEPAVSPVAAVRPRVRAVLSPAPAASVPPAAKSNSPAGTTASSSPFDKLN